MPNYEGCDCGGEHHTTGERAWCLDCSEWCYPGEGTQCEIAVLRAFKAEATELLGAWRSVVTGLPSGIGHGHRTWMGHASALNERTLKLLQP